MSTVRLVRDTRSRNAKLIYGFVLIGLAVGLAVMVPSWGFMAGLGAAILGISGLSVFLTAFGFSGRGPCPSCGAERIDVPRDIAGIACPKCGAYATVQGGEMSVTPDDAVATSSVFSFTVEPGTQPNFPARCVGCGKPATQHLPWQLTKTMVGVPGVGRVVRKWSISVPLCDEHATPGPLGLPTGINSFADSVSIRSHRVWLLTTGRQTAASSASDHA